MHFQAGTSCANKRVGFSEESDKSIDELLAGEFDVVESDADDVTSSDGTGSEEEDRDEATSCEARNANQKKKGVRKETEEEKWRRRESEIQEIHVR